jgi:hypothetical protein
MLDFLALLTNTHLLLPHISHVPHIIFLPLLVIFSIIPSLLVLRLHLKQNEFITIFLNNGINRINSSIYE